METVKCRSIPNNKSKIAKTFQRLSSRKTATRIASTNGTGVCMLTPHDKFEEDALAGAISKTHKAGKHKGANTKSRRKTALEALVAKLFAGITTIKAAYAELQTAENPYDSEAIQAADHAVVEELKQLSELKRSFLRKDIDHLSSQVTVMLAEVQEQQSLMKTYAITIKKLEAEAGVKDSEICSLKKEVDDTVAFNQLLQKKVNASGPLSMFDSFQFAALNPTHFVQFLHCALRSIRSFVKLMVREMEIAHWDIDAAAKAIEAEAVGKPSHQCFVFESFVSKTMLEGFNHPGFLISSNESHLRESHFFNEFKKLKSVNTKRFLAQNPDSPFARFTRAKYLQLVHAKMECSLFGNLNQRKLVNSGGFPDSDLFNTFAEMARRVWTLNLLAFAFGSEVGVFQVSKNCRFSEVYMESVTNDESLPEEIFDLRVGFTVVPGFKIGKNVIQSQVYLLPRASTSVSS